MQLSDGSTIAQAAAVAVAAALWLMCIGLGTAVLPVVDAQSHSYAQVHRPPHYHYSYRVMDPQFGAQFGQEEYRHGKQTKGTSMWSYSVKNSVN